MLEIMKQLALDVMENGADFCTGIVMRANPLTIRIEEGLELTKEFLLLTENVQEGEEKGTICLNGGNWNRYQIKRDRRLQAGETVALLRAADGQEYLVLGRVGKEG